MTLTESLLESISGDLSFCIYLDKKPVAQITLHDKEIKIEIKSIVSGLESIVPELIKNKGKGSFRKKIDALKKKGYKIKVKYSFFEVEL